jgi:hypothetical protein
MLALDCTSSFLVYQGLCSYFHHPYAPSPHINLIPLLSNPYNMYERARARGSKREREKEGEKVS